MSFLPSFPLICSISRKLAKWTKKRNDCSMARLNVHVFSSMKNPKNAFDVVKNLEDLRQSRDEVLTRKFSRVEAVIRAQCISSYKIFNL